jgi:pantoate--beta-alanine ligase
LTVPRVIRSVAEWRQLRRSAEFAGRTLGLVPTMGALHEGHAELLRRAAAENDRVVMWLFVNPTQFNDPADLQKYPRDLEKDAAIVAACDVQYILAPEPAEMYADQYRYEVREKEFSKILEGEHRPGHFEGVLTVVLKLLLLAQADRAYFGEKDFQQLELVRGMAAAFFIGTEIVAIPTVREPDGLAMSSRNVRLTPVQRQQAVLFPQLLQSNRSLPEIRSQLEKAGFAVDYIEERDNRRLGAVRLGDVRLIDNFELIESRNS